MKAVADELAEQAGNSGIDVLAGLLECLVRIFLIKQIMTQNGVPSGLFNMTDDG
jgi:hypothetical protein